MSFFTPDIFLRPELLFGAALAIVPILLHLLMRTKPKKLLFPALRLIQNRQKNNVRRLQLRHLWLLLLRIAVIVLIVLAIARPSLPAANYSLTGSETATLLAVLGLAVAVYFGLMARWRKQRLPQHAYNYRRSMLRGGTGLAIALLLLLLVFWPYQRRIAAEIEAPAAELSEDLPIAAAFLFDTSLSMQYRHEGKTRLEQAQEIAAEYLSQLPAASRVAVGGTSSDDPFSFREDLTVAQGDVERLSASAVQQPLNQRVRQALQAQEQDYGRTLDAQTGIPEDNRQDQFLREIYIFTDLSETAWRKSGARLLREDLERLKFINVYVIDLSVDNPRNAMVESLKLSSQNVSLGTPLSVDVTLLAMGQEEMNQTVEVIATNAAGKQVPQGKRMVRLKPGEPVVETFQLTDLAQPFAQGVVSLGGGDPLDVDNRRYFTVGVQIPPRILIVSGEEGEGDYLKAPLAPKNLEELGRAPFRVDQEQAKWLDANLEELGNYAVICLVNVPAPRDAVWNALAEFVDQGGGLAIFLGSGKIDSLAYNTEAAQSLVPGELIVRRQFNPPETLSLSKREHPLFQRLFELNGATEFSQLPVYECWRVKPAENASVVDWYTQTGGQAPTPAIVERSHGTGRVVMLTTGVSLETGQLNWSDLAMPSWQFLVFAHDLMKYLNREASARLNFQAGDEAIIRLDNEREMENYLFRTPDGAQQSRSVPAGQDFLTLVETAQPGHYRVLDANPDSDFAVGFSVNLPPEESNLNRLTADDLNEMFGENRYRISRDLEELERIVTEGRLGQELFPQVLFLVIVAFCAEHLVSNRFYETDQAPGANDELMKSP